MAVTGKEVEILGIGTTPIQYSNGAFVLNMLHRKGGWEVRKGFGQRAEYTTTFGTRFFDGAGPGSFSAAPQGMPCWLAFVQDGGVQADHIRVCLGVHTGELESRHIRC